MGRPGTWPKGTSGNPNGRPPKHRALTEILRKRGSRTIEDVDGKRRSGNRVVARLMWDGASTGRIQFPDGRTLTLKLNDWLDLVKFLHVHIDGPAKAELGLDHSGELIIRWVDDWRDTATEAT